MEIKKIIIAGEGGQGIQTIASLVTKTAYHSGSQVAYLPNFGVEQRGGVSLAFIQIDKDEPIGFPKFKHANILVLLAPRAIKRIENYVTDNTLIIFDNSLIQEKELAQFKTEKMAIPATHLAKEKLSPRVFNMIILGALLEELGYKEKLAEKTITAFFKEKTEKKPQLKHLNARGYQIGAKTVKELSKK